MQATLALREKMAQLLAADTATLAPAADANMVQLVTGVCTPTESSVVGDFTPATFDGSDALSVTLGTQAEGLDPATNDAIISLGAPVGGWRWETTGLTNLPQTVTGVIVTDNAGTLLLCAKKLDTPITLTAANQVIDLGPLELRQLANSLV